MIDRMAARAAVEAELASWGAPSPEDSWEIYDEHTIERKWGWVFFYGSRRFRETGETRYAVAGNAPFIVRRSDGALFVTGTAMPIADYILQFEEDGTLV